MSDVLTGVLADLAAESAQIESWVADLDDAGWSTITTPEGWTVAHQIAHLAWTDWASLVAIGGGEPFGDLLKTAAADPTGFIDVATEEWAQVTPADQLARWRDGRAALAQALASVPAGEKIAWFGPPMSPASMGTARIMETWAHGQDVAEGLGLEVPKTDRCKHVCHIGIRTRGFVHMIHDRPAPTWEVRVELVAPSGELWTWGPEDAEQRVTGDAWDFALLATRRRDRTDVNVVAEGADADAWLDIIQSFAGLPGNDPKPLAERTIGR